jgi:hypothetical protein
MPEVEIIPLGSKIRQVAGEIVSAFEDRLMVQYHCGAVSAASVRRSVGIVEVTSRSPICGEGYRCAIAPHNNNSSCCILYTTLLTLPVLHCY